MMRSISGCESTKDFRTEMRIGLRTETRIGRTGLRKWTPLILLASVLVAGCWQTVNRPYRDVTSLQPFAAGEITETGPDRKATHYALRKIARGRYRMTQTDRGQDFGQGFELGFFPLPGAPSDVLIYQAASLEHTAGEDNLRYYGLLVVRGPKSVEEIRPDCDKDARAAARLGHARRQGRCLYLCRSRRVWKSRCWLCGRAAKSRSIVTFCSSSDVYNKIRMSWPTECGPSSGIRANSESETQTSSATRSSSWRSQLKSVHWTDLPGYAGRRSRVAALAGHDNSGLV